MTAAGQNVKITNPERIARLLQRVAAGGIPVQVRSMGQLETAVKGRAVSSGSIASKNGLSIAGISEKGRNHLRAFSGFPIQIEFVLSAVKIVFSSTMIELNENEALFGLPASLTSIERRKNGRFPMTMGTRAYLKLDNWNPSIQDSAGEPFFEYQRNIASLLQFGDVSVGGISIVSRFPALCRVLQKGVVIEKTQLMFPLSEPVPAIIQVRWVKRLRESIQGLGGSDRTFRAYKFGVQFVDPSEKLEIEIQKFISKLSMSEAI